MAVKILSALARLSMPAASTIYGDKRIVGQEPKALAVGLAVDK